MAKKRGFFAEMQHQAQVAEQQRLRADRVAQREYEAAIRRQEAARKKAAAAQVRAERAAVADAKRDAAEAKRLYQEARVAEVDQMNSELAATYDAIDSILKATLDVDDFVDLMKLRTVAHHPPFPHPELERPIPAPKPIPIPPEPMWSEPQAPKGIQAVVRKKRFLAEREEQWLRFQGQHQHWQQTAASIPARQLAQLQEHQRLEADRRSRLQVARNYYEAEYKRREQDVAAANGELETLLSGLETGDADAVDEYVSIVLANSVYPPTVPVDYEYTFDSDLRELTITVSVPQPTEIPKEKAYRYVKSDDEITSSDLAQKAQKDRYNGLIYNVALRTPHEVFEADRGGHIRTISQIVQTETVDPATGRPMVAPFVALATDRVTFEGIDLARVDPIATLSHLSAQVSKNPHGLVTIDTSKGVRR